MNRYSKKSANNRHRIYQHTFISDQEDKLLIDIHIIAPNNYFVFTKNSNGFQSIVEFTLTVVDANSTLQKYQHSWEEVVQESYYEDTRDLNEWVLTNCDVILPAGKYDFSVIIQDKDSKRKWDINQEIEIEEIKSISSVLPLMRIDDQFLFAGKTFDSGEDTLFCKYQLTEKFPSDDAELLMRTFRDQELLDSSLIVPSPMENSDYYLSAIKLKKNWVGKLDFELEYNSEKRRFSVEIIKDSFDKYFIDTEELVQWMSIILPHNEYMILKKMKKKEQRHHLLEYWNENDPTPDTQINELLDEFYERVQYANSQFGVLTVGWRSDQGRIYIKFGTPVQVETTQPDNYGRTYQIWYYQSNKQFVFLNDGFGDYRLVREVN